MSLLLLALSLVQASAAVPVRLPAQEKPAEWVEALSIAGLSVGAPGDGAWVEIVAGGSQWTLRVRDRAGAMHQATVPPPRTPQEREDLALLAASLLQPMAVAAPVKPPPAPAPPKPRPVVAPPPVAPPVAAPVVPPPAPPAPPPEPPAPEPAPPVFSGRFGIAGEARMATRPTGVAWGEVQYVGESPLRPAFGVGVTAPATLPALATEVSFWGGEAWFGAWYAAEVPARIDLGLAAGVAARAFTQEGEARGVLWLPTLSTRVEVPVRVSSGLLLEPGAHLVTDLGEIDLTSRSEGPVRFGDWSFRVSIGLRPSREKPPEP